MNIPSVFWIVPIASIVALGMAFYFFKSMLAADEGTPRMREIAKYVRDGAMAYLKQQYKVVTYVFIALAILFSIMAYVLHVQNPWVPFAFLTGGFFSGLAGFFGMKTATYASGRTANAARKSLDSGLKIAFRSGAVMGLTVVGLGLLDIAIWFVVLNIFDTDGLISITTTMLTFGMGASTQALFARVGGGIYTKAADVGADIVGKVEADIPEDDPRNPATIADNVGDNVGDVAGMGADLYESYCGSVLSTAALGAAAFSASQADGMQLKAVIAPMLIAAVGVFLSLIGIYLVRTKEGATMRDLLKSLSLGTNVSAVLIAVATFAILYLLGINNWLGLSCSVITGLAAGVIIGQATEYYTSHSYKPTQKISEAGLTGSATVIIKGIGTGMISTCIPVITIGVAIMLSYLCANGFDLSMSSGSLAHGLYGVGIAAVGMLSTRQCRRQCRDERAGRGSAPPHRCTRCPGQHHSRHWQRLRHRFGSPHGPGSAGFLHRGDKDCHVACWRDLDQSGRRNHQRCRCHHPRLYELLPGEPYEPESARGSLHRSHGSLPLLRTHYGSRGPSCPEDGC